MSNHVEPITGAADPAPRHLIYIPGYKKAKLGLALLGLALLGLSLDKLGPVARLAATGSATRAEAVQIVRTDSSGAQELEPAYKTDAQVQTAVKGVETQRDSSSVFWCVYRFTTGDGKVVETRSPLGAHLKPMQPLKDADGLPSTIKVWYDPAHPEHIVLPLELGTWFMPGMLVLFGTLATFMGLTLWWHSGDQIEMPDLSQSHGELAK